MSKHQLNKGSFQLNPCPSICANPPWISSEKPEAHTHSVWNPKHAEGKKLLRYYSIIRFNLPEPLRYYYLFKPASCALKGNISPTHCNNFATFVPASSQSKTKTRARLHSDKQIQLLPQRSQTENTGAYLITPSLSPWHLPHLHSLSVRRGRTLKNWNFLSPSFCFYSWRNTKRRVTQNIIISVTTRNPLRQSVRRREEVGIILGYQNPYYCSCAWTDRKSLSSDVRHFQVFETITALNFKEISKNKNTLKLLLE